MASHGLATATPGGGDTVRLADALARRIAGGGALDFAREALAIFAHQYEHNGPYRLYCLRQGRTPSTVADWRDIPAVSTTAFTVVDLACAPPERVFRTSGTTRGPGARGRHLVPALALYRAAALPHFADCVAPDGMRGPVLALAPAPDERPDSSLVQMIDWIGEAYGVGNADYFVSSGCLDRTRLEAALESAVAAGTPIYLVGLTGAFEALFASWSAAGKAVRLPYGSRIVDTGGAKDAAGRGAPARPLSRAGFLAACWRHLNVPGYHCINEYGMTELCSQLYDNVLRERVAGRLAARCLVGPAWLRTLVVDPETLAEVPHGTPGLLRHYDLANLGSVLAVQTEDVGVATDEGILLRGRLRGAEPRGCAMLLETFASANAGCDPSSSGPG
jgi:hypothetical protein